jgi:hypothetical protein
MKKFTNYNNTEKKAETSLVEKINILVESASVEVEGEETPWTKNISVKSTPEIVEAINKLIQESILKEKLELLEKAKKSTFTGDVSWISDEIEKIKNQLK